METIVTRAEQIMRDEMHRSIVHQASSIVHRRSREFDIFDPSDGVPVLKFTGHESDASRFVSTLSALSARSFDYAEPNTGWVDSE